MTERTLRAENRCVGLEKKRQKTVYNFYDAQPLQEFLAGYKQIFRLHEENCTLGILSMFFFLKILCWMDSLIPYAFKTFFVRQ